jgi:hypothetical protein
MRAWKRGGSEGNACSRDTSQLNRTMSQNAARPSFHVIFLPGGGFIEAKPTHVNAHLNPFDKGALAVTRPAL